jgi:alpha-1,3-rhamnosyl/mannosyltransferase
VLTVSAKRPHKNLGRLLEAFARVQATPAPVLVAPGYPTVFESELRRRAGPRIHLTGWLDDETLEGLYAAAACFVFPSLAEGFGLPVLDAMTRGVPVACSDRSSLPEIGGDAVLYFDPTDVAAISDAMLRLLTDTQLREQLRAAGRLQAAKFSWKATAEATLESYRRALESPGAR